MKNGTSGLGKKRKRRGLNDLCIMDKKNCFKLVVTNILAHKNQIIVTALQIFREKRRKFTILTHVAFDAPVPSEKFQ